MKKKYLLMVAAVLMATLLVGCGDDDPDTARLRIVHAAADAPNVDVLVDGRAVATNIPFREFTQYLEVRAGNRRLEVRPAGSATSVIDVTANLTANADFTAIAYGPVATISAAVLADNNSAPPSGQVKVRLVHGSPTAGPVDIYVTAPNADLATTQATLTNVPFKGVSDYLTVAAGDYRVRITPTGTKLVAIDSGTLSLTSGQIRTAVAVDAVNGGLPLGAILLTDAN